MPANKHLLAVVREWVAKAENDWKTAVHMLKLGGECPTDTVCFHAQQCVEKYLKALLVLQSVAFPKTHNIEELMARLPAAIRPRLSSEDQERLTDFAAVVRYPGTYDPILLAEARRVVKTVRGVRSEIRKAFPKSVLLRRRT